jgi:hypothetical protein
MLSFIALSVDVGYMYAVKTRLQAAADAGACAGAIALADGDMDAEAIAAAIQFTEENRAYDSEFSLQAEDVELGVWDEATATFTAVPADDEGNPNAVRVYCRRTSARGNEVGLFFAKIMGNDYADITATATARFINTKCGIIVGLSGVTLAGGTYADSYQSDDGPYFPGTALQNGNVCSNGDIMIAQTAYIDGDAHPGAEGSFLDYSTGDASGSTTQLTTELSYPDPDMSEAAASNNNANIPLSDNGVNPYNAFGQLVLGGVDHVDLPPGTYYFTQISLTGGATIGVSGETLIFVDGNVIMSGASILNDTAIPQNLQIYCSGTSFTMSGTAAFYGVVYAPRATVGRSGTTDFYGSIIANQLTSSGYGGIHADDSLEVDMLDVGVKRTALVE